MGFACFQEGRTQELRCLRQAHPARVLNDDRRISRRRRSLCAAFLAAKAEAGRPSSVSLRGIIGYSAPKKRNFGKIRGSAPGADEVASLNNILGFDPESRFHIEADVLERARAVVRRGAESRTT
ncbi:hypothetical protein [Microbacterium maritypicum]|uniref:hypothetical protein n=1 Tax=Microbacterium maritypicum TaxID=33918 RepID=UPI0027DCD39A|nr:hypothetical protein [Microbacterium liquefaciens]